MICCVGKVLNSNSKILNKSSVVYEERMYKLQVMMASQTQTVIFIFVSTVPAKATRYTVDSL